MAFNTEWRVVDNYNNTGRRYFVVPMAELAFEITDTGIGTGFFLAAAAPQGGLPTGLGRYPALAKGDQGFSPTLVLSSFTELAWDDPTEASCDIIPIADATEVSGPVYGVNLTLHAGKPGLDGAAEISPSDYGVAAYGQQLTVAAGAGAFELTWPKVGGLHVPASLSSAPDGTTAEFTMGAVSIATGKYNFPYTFKLAGNAVTIGSTSDIRVDLIVRLNDETGGNIIGRGVGLTQKTGQPNIVTGVESGSAVVAAGAASTLYFRTKKMSGTATYGADQATARFEALVVAAL